MPSASEIIALWEKGVGQHPVDRAVVLAAAAYGAAPEQARSLPIGRRDAGLLQLRQSIFGNEATAVAKCPRCAEALEFTLQTADLLADSPPEREPSGEVTKDSLTVKFRLPDSADLKAVASCPDVASGERLLLRRCVQPVADGPGGEALPEALVAEIGLRMAECDPLADVALDMECAACGHEFHVAFDIASFLWQELEALAKGLLLEVHTLARAYGWSEAEILALTPGRRHQYLELAG